MSLQKAAPKAMHQINAVVVSAGLMQKTVKVRVGVQKWNAHIRKNFSQSKTLLVHDPNSSLLTGDIISISPGTRYSKQVHHVVNSIIYPFGVPIEERNPVLSAEEREKVREEKRREKEGRRKGLAKVEGKRTREEGRRKAGEVVGKEEVKGEGVGEGEDGGEGLVEGVKEVLEDIKEKVEEKVEEKKRRWGWSS